MPPEGLCNYEVNGNTLSSSPGPAEMVAQQNLTLRLYREMLRSAKHFTNYNFREYAMRRVREEFRIVRSNDTESAKAYESGLQQLAMLRRQSTISSMYPQGKHAME